MAEAFFDDILSDIPPSFTRKDVIKYFGSVISPKYLANLDSAGKGPKRSKTGNKVVYKRKDFIEWLNSRIK